MNSGKPLISVVIPSYNDEPIIRPFYKAIADTLSSQKAYDYELIYVDDGSSDGSQETLASLAEEDGRITYLELFRNFGQQRALFAGLSASKGDFVVTLDGDYQYKPEVIFQLVSAMGNEYDMASGIRTNRMDSWRVKLFSKIGNKLIRHILGVSIQDFGSVKAFSRSLVNKILNMKHYFSDVYPSALALQPTFIEVPVLHNPRPIGRSHWNVWKRFRLYVDLYVGYGDDQLQIPFRFGFLCSLGGLFFGICAVIYKSVFGHSASFVELGAWAFTALMLGMFFMAWSMTMSFLIRIYKQNIWGEPYVIRRVLESRKDSKP
jgi:undecaprenyl-phosphate 4-deoxy-4-formamido-L-arabinose transferase